MPLLARTIGGPGAGKTHRAIGILEQVFSRKEVGPLQVGFVSFTRAARREASSRAADRFGVPVNELERQGYYRTLHSIAYRQLRIQPGELLAGTADDSEWLRNALGDDKVRLPARDEDDDALTLTADHTDCGKALALWETARNRQVPLESVWLCAGRTDDRLPDLGRCQAIAIAYEQAKRSDGRCDFSDLLLRFAGRRFSGNHASPWEDVEPEGDVPYLPVVIHDEMQDCFQLSALVFRRLIQPSTWVYLFGDSAQSIYAFGGADGSIFAGWPVQREEELPTSYRCRQEILDYSYRILARNRTIPSGRAAFRSHVGDGAVLDNLWLPEALASVKPGQDVLILARTNEYARECARLLDDSLIPWLSTKGGNTWTAPARLAGVTALVKLRAGEAIDGTAYWRLLQLLPSKADGRELFIRGTKSFFDEEAERQRHPPLTLAKLTVAGGTQAVRDLIGSGKIIDLLDKPAAKMLQAAQQYGLDAIGKPTVKVGTQHSAKGMGADRVIAVNRIPLPTVRGLDDLDTLEEERRLWYVTCSRAKQHLTIAETSGEPFPEI